MSGRIGAEKTAGKGCVEPLAEPSAEAMVTVGRVVILEFVQSSTLQAVVVNDTVVRCCSKNGRGALVKCGLRRLALNPKYRIRGGCQAIIRILQLEVQDLKVSLVSV
jgi:hypothetical protein